MARHFFARTQNSIINTSHLRMSNSHMGIAHHFLAIPVLRLMGDKRNNFRA
jgi:hypothetical protein